MQDNSALGRALAVVRDLRARCPWDRVQTRATLRPYLVEEVLELDQALGGGDPDEIRDELGDFLLHLAWQLVIAEERGEFTPDQVADGLERKMRRRHPHLYDLGPRESWETLKRRERPRGTLDGLPPTLPPLLMAYRLQERAAGVGFDWPDAAGPLAKVREELDEVERELASPPSPRRDERLAREIGDLLFSVVNLARKLGVAPTVALDGANRKFRARFAEIERLAAERGIEVASAGLEVLDRLWDEAKLAEPADG
ncbi:MAG TPA: nucleoside triphosphate pyrophosphohydrolase [Gemmatimonadales bacterium]|nr:nucleoside triphosphate pyrophosphohydrolase [Gemmatimonadales bacterium]